MNFKIDMLCYLWLYSIFIGIAQELQLTNAIGFKVCNYSITVFLQVQLLHKASSQLTEHRKKDAIEH